MIKVLLISAIVIYGFVDVVEIANRIIVANEMRSEKKQD